MNEAEKKLQRHYQISPKVLEICEKVLAQSRLTFKDTRRLAESILHLSDYFIHQPLDATPWDQSWAVEAYFSYYLPLNEIRNRAVVEEGLRLGFFEGLDRVVDFGAGPASAEFALQSVSNLQQFSLIERSSTPERLLLQAGAPTGWKVSQELSSNHFSQPRSTLFVASYSLTEAEIPEEALQAEALMILEPATQADGRKLLDLRARLLQEGYSMWAPCTHQMDCPLRKNSPRDWCHDRVHVDRPPWLVEIENLLPFRNQTVTFSYLLARKKPAPKMATGAARLVGDWMKEKGKDRQMVCRSDEREFLAWLHRYGPSPELPRGIRVQIPETAKKVSNEVRLEKTPEIL